MSINLISRRLCSSLLRLAPQRVVSPRSISTPITTTQPSVLLQLPTTPQSYNNNNNNNINNSAVQQRRSFSISTTLQPNNNNDDDGGPIPDFDELSNKALQDMTTIPGWNLVHNPPRRNPRGALVGKVVSDKMQKTVNVAVDRYKLIPKYRKRWRYTKVSVASLYSIGTVCCGICYICIYYDRYRKEASILTIIPSLLECVCNGTLKLVKIEIYGT